MAQRLGPAAARARPQGGPRGGPRRVSQSSRAGAGRREAASAWATPSSAAGSTTKTCPPVRDLGPDRLRHGPAGLRLPVHLLHRSVHAGTGAQSQIGRRGAARWPAWRGRGPPRSRSSGRRSTPITTAPTTSPTCSARWSGGWHPAAPVHQSLPHRLHRPGHCGDGRGPGGVRARASPGPERLQRGAPPDAPALHPRALSRGGRPAPRGHPRHHLFDRHHRRISGRNRGAVRGDAVAWLRRRASTTRTPSGTRCGKALRRCGCRDHGARRGGAASGSSGWSLPCGARRGAGTWPGSARCTRCWSSAPRAGAACCWPDPHQSPGPARSARDGDGEYHQVRLTGTTGSTFTGTVAKPPLAVL